MTAEPIATQTAAVEGPTTFDAMKLSEPMRRAIADIGWPAPTAVQTAAFNAVAAGRDVIVQSRTGSGKTAAFAIPLLDRVVQPEKRVQAMVLCPTRELALQVGGEVSRLGKYRGITVAAIYGGASMTKQIDELQAGAQFVAGTPGRVLDHLRRGTLDVSGLKAIVLDEADEMLSMGFAEEINAILDFIPKKRQGLLFSATMPDQIQRIARRHLTTPEFLALSSDNIAPSEVTHYAYFVGMSSRTRELARILEIEKPDAAIVFCNTKHETETVASDLRNLGLDAEYINGDLEQAARERIMGAFRAKTVKYLVATDVAARGIDVSDVTHVVNFGFPESAEQYVHRTGRTGRAGKRGTAISLITPQDVGNLYLLRLTYGIRPIERALPSASEDRTRRELDRIQLLREGFGGAPSDEAISLARRLLTADDAETMVAGLVSEFFNIATKQAIARGISPAGAATALLASQRAERSQPQRSETRPAPAPAPIAVPRAAPAPAFEGAPRPPREPREPRGRTEGRGPERDRPPPARVAPVAERPRKIEVHHGEGVLIEDESPEVGMDEMRVAVGRRDGIRAGDIVRLVRDKAALNRRDIGRIHVRDRFSLVSIRAEMLEATIAALRDAQLNDRPLTPERGKGLGSTIAPPPGDADPGVE